MYHCVSYGACKHYGKADKSVLVVSCQASFILDAVNRLKNTKCFKAQEFYM